MSEDSSSFLEAGPCKIPSSEIQFEFSRAGGPGGQNVNKVESRVTIRFDLLHSPSIPETLRQRSLHQLRNRLNDAGELVISSQESRSQFQNRAICLRKLKELLEPSFRPPNIRRKSKPTRASKLKRLESKRRDSEKKRFRRQNDE